MARVLQTLGRALRETGQALDRVGIRALEKPVFKEQCEGPLLCVPGVGPLFGRISMILALAPSSLSGCPSDTRSF